METALAAEHRVEPRSNIFVMATLYAAGGSTPVRIRNMSRTGALVEATALPPSGSPIRLSRGSLSIAGQVVWVAGPKAGVHFASGIAVADWLPNGKRGSGQQLVDELVHQSRLGTISMTAPPDLQLITRPPSVTADELVRLQKLLERAGEELAADSLVAATHLMALQLIDGVAQTLAKLAAQDGDCAIARSATA
jgi:hypothetical protein